MFNHHLVQSKCGVCGCSRNVQRSSHHMFRKNRALCVMAVSMQSDKAPRIAVVALGGNALQRRNEPATIEGQARNARDATRSLAALVHEKGVQLCITHGNGPQVGRLAEIVRNHQNLSLLRAQIVFAHLDPRESLAVLGAESQGQIGFLLEEALAETLPGLEFAALLTQTLVYMDDVAFKKPTKFIGPEYSESQARALETEKGYSVAQDGDSGWRRVVASPTPLKIMNVHAWSRYDGWISNYQASAIRLLLDGGVIVICCGGGGIPIVEEDSQDGSNRRRGVEAVIDKDAASALLAELVGADMLLLLTDAPHVFDPRKWPEEKVPLKSPITPNELEGYEFASGSMGPKIAAALGFVRATGRPCGIGDLHDALDVVHGKAGTWIVADG